MTPRIDPAALDRLLAPFDRTDAPGFAVGVALAGIPAYRRGVGLASVELPVALSPSIRMRIGSTTKHFCALAILLLAEDGKLTINDSPRRHLPELPDWAEAMTLRQLMAHTSGMRDSLDLALHTAGPGKSAAPDMLFHMLTRIDSIDFPPGTSWSYNNGGYVLLTEIVERVSFQSFAAFLTERILAPCGMHDTMLRPLDTDLVPNSATLHVPTPGGGWTRGIFGVPIGGMGGLVSTVDDMLRWLAHMRRPIVGKPESWAALQQPVTTHGYGLGLFTTMHRGLRTIHHAGGVVGGASQMLTVPEHALDIIVMTNGRSALELYGLVDAIIDACIPGLPPPQADAGGMPVTGTFHSLATGRVLTLAADGDRQTITIGGMTLPALRDADGAISQSLLPTDLRVTPVQRDGATVLEALEFGNQDVLRAVAQPDGADLATLAGRYANAAADITAVITRNGDATVLRLTGETGSLDYTLAQIGAHLFQARAASTLPLVVTLERDADDLLMTTGRTARLRLSHVD